MAVFLSFFKRLFRKNDLRPEAAFIVGIEDGQIVNRRPEGAIERVRLCDLKAVIIETNDSGPWGADIWWILFGDEQSGCVFPGGATGESQVLEELQKLEGFDHQAFINAMGSTENRRFVCWRSATGTDVPASGGV